MVKLSTTISTLTRKIGRSWATASPTIAPRAITARKKASLRFKLISPPKSEIGRQLLAGLLPHILANHFKRTQQRRPVLQVGGKNSFHRLLGPGRNQHVQLRWNHVSFISQRGVVEQVGLPALRQNATRISHQRREGAEVKQLRLE